MSKSEAGVPETLYVKKWRSRGIAVNAASFAAAAGAYLAAAALARAVRIPAGAAAAALTVCVAFAFAVPLLWKALAAAAEKKFGGMSVGQQRDFLLSHRENAAETTRAKLAVLRRLRLSEAVLAVVLGAAGLGIPFFFAEVMPLMGGFGTFWLPAIFLGGAVLDAALTQLPPPRAGIEGSGWKDAVMAREDYPRLYELAARAAERAGFRYRAGGSGGTVIVAMTGFDALLSVTEDRGGACLFLSVNFMALLTEDELYSAMLHEFAHLASGSAETDVAFRYETSLRNRSDAPYALARLRSFFFGFPDSVYFREAALLRYASSVSAEEKADSFMKECAGAAASALLKSKYIELYSWEDAYADCEPFFAAEEPPADSVTREVERIRGAIPSRVPDWNALAAAEIRSRSATHPTEYERIVSLGVTELPTEPVFPDGEGEWPDECRKAVRFGDALCLGRIKEDYGKLREEYWLKPSRTVAGWEAEGRPLRAEEYTDVMDALMSLGRYGEMAALADRAISELPPSASHYGYFYRGLYRIHSYDRSGIDDLYRSAEANGNYTEAGVDVIGRFCCLCGLQRELDEYRERSVGFLQKYRDEDMEIKGLSKKDDLSAESLPEGMLESILAYVESVSEGRLDRVYLVRKTVRGGFFTSAFVLRFFGGISAEDRGEVLHKVFRHLDTCSDRQFSLYDYDSIPVGTVESVSGSCVWSRGAESGGNG